MPEAFNPAKQQGRRGKMKATDELRHEHQIILLVLDAAERAAKSLRGNGKVDVEKLEKFLDFARVFVDRCHHASEEEYLFPKLQEKDLATFGPPVKVMLQEHDRGGNCCRPWPGPWPGPKAGTEPGPPPWPQT